MRTRTAVTDRAAQHIGLQPGLARLAAARSLQSGWGLPPGHRSAVGLRCRHLRTCSCGGVAYAMGHPSIPPATVSDPRFHVKRRSPSGRMSG